MRVAPWRSKMPHELFELLEQAYRTTLYVVQEWGPTSFTLKDQASRKYKVTVGAQVTCSCQPTRKDHCLHSLFLLVKMFKLDRHNPLVWQASYVDAQLKGLCEGKFQGQPRRSRPVQEKEKEAESKVKRRELQEDPACCICQEDMSPSVALSFCRTCGNNFHVKCLRIWGEHKVETKTPITCPMCRGKWPSLLSDLNKEAKQFQLKNKPKGKSAVCSNCCQQTEPYFFRCVYCPAMLLCYSCYSSNVHPNHDRWLLKEGGKEYSPAVARSVLFKNQKNKKDKLASEFNQGSLMDFLVDSLPNGTRHLEAMLTREERTGKLMKTQQMACVSCGSVRLMWLRRLPCSHYLDEGCLRESIEREQFQCPVRQCKKGFLKGYAAAFKKPQKRRTAPELGEPAQGTRLTDILGPVIITKKDLVNAARSQSRPNQQPRAAITTLRAIQEPDSMTQLRVQTPRKKAPAPRKSEPPPVEVRPKVSQVSQVRQAEQFKEQQLQNQLIQLQVERREQVLNQAERQLQLAREPGQQRRRAQPMEEMFLVRSDSEQRRNRERESRMKERQERLRRIEQRKGNGARRIDELFDQAKRFQNQLRNLL